MRGDRPPVILLTELGYMFTPHARGSTRLSEQTHTVERVYPACAGIDRAAGKGFRRSGSLPRMRGDRPYATFLYIHAFVFTPHARGSTSEKT